MTDRVSRNVVILAGGISHERDVSLRSGRRLADALITEGYKVTIRDPDATLLPYLTENRPDVIWPALHGANGEDGSLQALLNAVAIPFVGARSGAASLAWHKPAATTIVSRAGLATPEQIAVTRDVFRELGAAGVLRAVAGRLESPIVVKPAEGGSAQGVTIVAEPGELPRAMVDAFTYCEVAVVERKITGTEIAVSVIDDGTGPVALPAVEVHPLDGVYSFEARYNAGETVFYTPARLDDDVLNMAATAAVDAHRALGLRHISRVDFIVDPEGTPWFLEANVLPGLTETSLLPLAIEAAGRTPGSVYASLAEAAISDAT